MSRFLLTLFFWGWWFVAVTSAENWPQFRGPTGQGIVSGKALPVAWGPAKNLIWRQALPGKAWSSPVVVDSRIYLTNAVPIAGGNTDQSLRALCLDAATGKVRWDEQVFLQE